MKVKQLDQVYFNPKQLKLPLLLETKIPFDSEARTFDEVFSKIGVEKYLVLDKDPRGRIGYNPVKMLKLILFCQMEKIQSLREMEKAAKNDIRIMWLTDELMPSHQTIKTFIDRYLTKNIQEIFNDFNKYFIEVEKIDTTKLYIDGTKIESKANKYTFVWRGSILKYEQNLHKKISKEIKKINETYKYENITFNKYEIYEEEYLNKIKVFLEREIKDRNIEFKYGRGKRKTAHQRHYENISEYLEKLIKYKKHLKIMGPNRNSYSKTDNDATFMRMKEDHMRNGQLKPGYNVQIGVADEYILHLDISSERNDYKTLIPFLEGYYKSYGNYPKYPVADAGYGGLVNYRYLKLNGMELFQKYNMYHKDTNDKKRMNDPYFSLNLIKDGDDYITIEGERLTFLHETKFKSKIYLLPNGKKKEINDELIEYKKEVIKNLDTEEGIKLRTQRSIQVEGAFGVIKDVFKARRFRRIGIENVKLEFFLTAIGYNLSKYHNKRYRIVD